MSELFKPLEECIELYKQGEESDTNFDWVFNCEQVWFEGNADGYQGEFDINGDIAAQVKEINENGDPDITNGRNIYEEFTQTICPAYKA